MKPRLLIVSMLLAIVALRLAIPGETRRAVEAGGDRSSAAAATSTPAGMAYLPIVLSPPEPSPSATPGPGNHVPVFSHVFIIILENQEYDNIIGNATAPYLNSLAQQYGLATNYYAIRHPSL